MYMYFISFGLEIALYFLQYKLSSIYKRLDKTSIYLSTNVQFLAHSPMFRITIKIHVVINMRSKITAPTYSYKLILGLFIAILRSKANIEKKAWPAKAALLCPQAQVFRGVGTEYLSINQETRTRSLQQYISVT